MTIVPQLVSLPDLPTCEFKVSKVIDVKGRNNSIHFRLQQDIYQTQLSFSNLNNFLDQSSTNLVLNLDDSAIPSVQLAPSDPIPKYTY
jgi:hypothetical protein